MKGNPFTPSFGTLPVVLVGRDEVLAGIAPLFSRFSKNDIHWATHLRGHRGVGKTVLLDQIQDAATRAGWWVLQEDAGAGPPLTAKIINRSLARLAEHDPPRRTRRISSLSAFGAGVGLEPTPSPPATVTSVRDVLDAVVGAEANGVLVTIDEAHQAPEKALNELGNAAQHLHRDGRPLVFVMAGLPRPERTREPTFLGRAWQPALGRLTDIEVERGLVDTAATAGGTFEPLALRRAVELAAGEPFLMQLVGYHAWDVARRARSPPPMSTAPPSRPARRSTGRSPPRWSVARHPTSEPSSCRWPAMAPRFDWETSAPTTTGPSPRSGSTASASSTPASSWRQAGDSSTSPSPESPTSSPTSCETRVQRTRAAASCNCVGQTTSRAQPSRSNPRITIAARSH